jgi:hypothetical protein
MGLILDPEVVATYRLVIAESADVPAAELDAHLAGAMDAFMRLHAARSRPEAVSSTP